MMRIGDFLVRSGALTSRQVDDILHLQMGLRRRHGPPVLFGRVALDGGYIDETDLGQWIEAKALLEEVAKGRAAWPTSIAPAPAPATELSAGQATHHHHRLYRKVH